jgi:hypothetical protein
MRIATGIVAGFIFMSNGPVSSASLDGAFYCVAEAVGGLYFDATTKSWRGVPFAASQKFVLRMKYLGTKTDEILKTNYDRFRATITDEGKSDGQICFDNDQPPPERYKSPEVSVYFNANFRCTSLTRDYVFNLKTNRFLSVYAYGYVDGIENNDNTPSVVGGRCTKID